MSAVRAQQRCLSERALAPLAWRWLAAWLLAIALLPGAAAATDEAPMPLHSGSVAGGDAPGPGALAPTPRATSSSGATQPANSSVGAPAAGHWSGAVLLSAFSAIVASIALVLWLTQVDAGASAAPRRHAMYLWAAVAQCCWAWRMADGTFAPPLAWPWWGLAMAACYAGWAAGALLFCHDAAGWQQHSRTRGLHLAMAAGVLGTILAAGLAMAHVQAVWLTAWVAFALLMAGAYVGALVVATVRQPDLARVLMSAAALAAFLVGVRDWAVFGLGQAYGDAPWMPLASVFVGIALLATMALRFRAVSQQARHWTATLSHRVAERERELAKTYSRLETVAREQGRTHERERILRDMHDGVGSHISTAIRLLRTGTASRDELLRLLGDSLDQLKLSIDSIHLPPGDIGALLASLRYRMAPRFAASDIAMEWAVEEIVPVPRIDGAGMRQLQFLLFEAIANVLQHAHARRLRIEAVDSPGALTLRISDDGVGFDARQLPRAMLVRAQALGARLTASSQPGDTVICLRLERTGD